MTIEQIIELLLQHGSLGLFAAYLIYESNRLRKQQAATVESFTTSIDQLRLDSSSSEKELRTRYDAVIVSLQQEKHSSQDRFGDKVRSLGTRLTALEKKTDLIMLQLEAINSTLSEFKFREIARTVKGK